ncbi:MAG TPA: cytochrome P450 [Trebonia sp.]|nr:cytochrome P450 [Trebonia sp.]
MTAVGTEERPARVAIAPGGLPLLGHARQLRFEPLRFLEAQRDRGDIVVFRIGPRRAYLINHPELVHQVLTSRRGDFVRGGPLYDAWRELGGNGVTTANGELHRRQRRLIQPMFQQARIGAYAEVMGEVAAEVAGSWHDGQHLAIDREMHRVSATVMGRCLYSVRLSARELDDIIESMLVIMAGLGRRAALPVRWAHALPTPGNRRFTAASRRMHQLAGRLIADGRASRLDVPDVLSTLLAARDEDTGESMPDQQVHDEVLTLLVSATETTAVGMSWVLGLLATRPDVDAEVRRELDTELGGRPVTYADLPRLPYLRATVTEALRLYPPVWLLPRLTVADTELGGCPIAAGSYVFYSPYASHHDPLLFPDPGSFAPRRWLPPDEAKPARCAHLSFGAGPRRCLGDTFAAAETAITVATIATRWRLRPDPGHPARPRPAASLGPGRLTLIAQRSPANAEATGQSRKYREQGHAAP